MTQNERYLRIQEEEAQTLEDWIDEKFTNTDRISNGAAIQMLAEEGLNRLNSGDDR